MSLICISQGYIFFLSECSLLRKYCKITGAHCDCGCYALISKTSVLELPNQNWPQTQTVYKLQNSSHSPRSLGNARYVTWQRYGLVRSTPYWPNGGSVGVSNTSQTSFNSKLHITMITNPYTYRHRCTNTYILIHQQNYVFTGPVWRVPFIHDCTLLQTHPFGPTPDVP